MVGWGRKRAVSERGVPFIPDLSSSRREKSARGRCDARNDGPGDSGDGDGGRGRTSAVLFSTSALNSVDFPTFGSPTIPVFSAIDVIAAARKPRREDCRPSAHPPRARPPLNALARARRDLHAVRATRRAVVFKHAMEVDIARARRVCERRRRRHRSTALSVSVRAGCRRSSLE